MRKLGKVALTILLLIGGGFVLYKLAYPTYTYRFRLSIAVDVDGETKTASSVIEVQSVTRPMAVIFSPVQNFVYGDAVFLNLGPKGNVIALLACNPDGQQDCMGTLVTNEFGIGGVENLAKLEALRGSRELTGRCMPTLVTFRDLNDPKSARVVLPNQFEKMFGSDVHFERAWIEMTDAPVTRNIESVLPWLRSHTGYLAGQKPDLTNTRPARNLTGNEFVKGL